MTTPPPPTRAGPGAGHVPRLRQGPRATPGNRDMVHTRLHRSPHADTRPGRRTPAQTERSQTLTNPRTHNLNGSAEKQGPLVRQPAPAARLARILHHTANELWELCALTDTNQMQTEASAIARRILATCPDHNM
jgi:hypothetical protein